MAALHFSARPTLYPIKLLRICPLLAPLLSPLLRSSCVSSVSVWYPLCANLELVWRRQPKQKKKITEAGIGNMAAVHDESSLGTSSTSNSTGTIITEYDSRLEQNAPISAILPGPEGELVLPHGRGSIKYAKDFLTPSEASTVLASTRNASSFRRTPISFTAKNLKFLQPRDTAFFGRKLYSYGGEKRKPVGWNEDAPASTMAKTVASKIETYLKLEPDYFDVVLINKYKGGRDFMEWHSDNERNLGDEPVIASLSVGEEREFLVRLRKDGIDGKPVDVIRYSLGHGSLLVMSGKMQRFYQHAVPKVNNDELGVRLNFTFRKIVDENNFSEHPTEG